MTYTPYRPTNQDVCIQGPELLYFSVVSTLHIIQLIWRLAYVIYNTFYSLRLIGISEAKILVFTEQMLLVSSDLYL